MNRTLFGGPSQPEPDDDRGGIKAAERIAKESESVVNPNQYENDNVGVHHKRLANRLADLIPELEISHPVDWTTDSQAAARGQLDLRWDGHLG